MPYNWTYGRDDVVVMFTPEDGPVVEVGRVVNGLIAEQLCRTLGVCDPHGGLLHTTNNSDGLVTG